MVTHACCTNRDEQQSITFQFISFTVTNSMQCHAKLASACNAYNSYVFCRSSSRASTHIICSMILYIAGMQAGEALTISYIDLELPRSARQLELGTCFFFNCKCVR